MQKPTPKNPYKKGPSWMVRFREKVRLPSGAIAQPERKAVLAACKGKDAIGKREADQLAWDRIFRPLMLRESCPGSLTTVREFYEHKYEPDVMPTLRKHGRETRASVFHRHVLPEIGAMRLRDVTVDTVKQLLRSKTEAGYSAQTVQHIRNAIGSLYRYAIEEQCYSGELPTAFRWREPMRRVRRRGALTFEQTRLLCEFFDAAYAAVEPSKRDREPNLGLLVRFLMSVGCRVGEALGLRWQNINLTAETVRAGELALPPYSVAIVEAFVRGEYSPVKVENRHERIVALPERLSVLLAEHRAESKFQAPGDPVFASSRGTPYHRENLSFKRLKPAITKLNHKIQAEGLKVEPFDPGFSWHWIRHTNASQTDAVGMSPVVRQKVLGHSSADMTMRYSHSEVELQRAGLELLWERLTGTAAPASKAAGKLIVYDFAARAGTA